MTTWHDACKFYPMLAQATTINPTPAQPETGYASWRASLNKTVSRFDPEPRTAGQVPSFGKMVHNNVLTAQSYAPAGTAAASTNNRPDIAYPEKQDGEDYTFSDVIDMINPLQHLPVIGTLYRKFTGDTIKPMSDIIGGAIFGGPIGAVASTMNAVVKSTTGKDIAENAFAIAGFDVTPEKNKPAISYDRNALVPVNNLANAIDLKITSNAINAYATADGRRNFAARSMPTEIWNA